MGHVERIIPDEAESGVVAAHLRRYQFALPWCDGKDVLDAACGAGYGSALLATVARRVVGVDISEDAVDYARRRYAAPNVEFRRLDLHCLELPATSFDVVCSFETIEHLADRDEYLRGVVRVLRPHGAFLVSTPRADLTVSEPENPYHAIEFSLPDFEQLLRRYFGDVELYGQRRLETRRYLFVRRLDVLGLRKRTAVFRPLARRLLGTSPTAEVTAGDLVVSRDGLKRASELIAVCRRPRLL